MRSAAQGSAQVMVMSSAEIRIFSQGNMGNITTLQDSR